jgi:hypothetical protein
VFDRLANFKNSLRPIKLKTENTKRNAKGSKRIDPITVIKKTIPVKVLV